MLKALLTHSSKIYYKCVDGFVGSVHSIIKVKKGTGKFHPRRPRGGAEV